MKLTEGQIAPDFKAFDAFGNEIKLSDYKGKKIILSFYRNVACPFCNRRVHSIMGNMVRLQNSGVKLVFIFESTNDKLLKSVFHQGIVPWPLIGDPDKVLYTKYGVENSKMKMMKTMFATNVMKAMRDAKALKLPKDSDSSMDLIPADFFIDENFRIVKAHYGKHLDDHIPLADIKVFAGLRI